jgi:hypothetical protein
MKFISPHRVANPNTHRAHASAIDRTIAAVGGRDHLLDDVADTEIGDALVSLWGGCAPATWNHNRAAVSAVREIWKRNPALSSGWSASQAFPCLQTRPAPDPFGSQRDRDLLTVTVGGIW